MKNKLKELNNKCAIFVSSCDAFSDAWEPFFKLFKRYWPNCPFPVYLISNQKEYNADWVETIKIFPDKGWASNMTEALNKVNCQYFIYFQEDYFFRSKVKTERILSLLNVLIKENAAYLRLWPSPGPDKKFKDYSDVGLIGKNSPYRTSLQAAIWNTGIFKNLLISGETGRDMEFLGSERSKAIENTFLSVCRSKFLNMNNNPAIDYFCTGVVKGKWNYGVIKFFKKQGIEIKNSHRKIEERARYTARFLRGLPTFGIFFRFYYKVWGKFKKISKIIARKFYILGYWAKSEILINLIGFRKSEQKEMFNQLKQEFLVDFGKIKNHGFDEYIINEWEKNLKIVEKYLLENLKFDFLRNPIISKTMFIGRKQWISEELEYIESKMPSEKIRALIIEDYIGKPFISNYKYLTSNNSIHHLYHLIRYLDKTSRNLKEIKTVIEWGGGYGNFAKIFWRLKKGNFTYIIIDLPIFSCLQFLYLSIVLGKDKVNFIVKESDSIVEGKINILPASFLNNFKLKCDLFVSTWAISESSEFSQNFAKEQGWLDSSYLLLAIQSNSKEFPFASRVEELAKNNTFSEEISFLPGNKYIFR